MCACVCTHTHTCMYLNSERIVCKDSQNPTRTPTERWRVKSNASFLPRRFYLKFVTMRIRSRITWVILKTKNLLSHSVIFWDLTYAFSSQNSRNPPGQGQRGRLSIPWVEGLGSSSGNVSASLSVNRGHLTSRWGPAVRPRALVPPVSWGLPEHQRTPGWTGLESWASEGLSCPHGFSIGPQCPLSDSTRADSKPSTKFH